MNQKIKAAAVVAGMIAISGIFALGLKLVSTYITPEMVPFILTAIGLSICIYTMYSLVLSHIQYTDKLKDMVDRK